jgi:hypothetical protein
MHLPVRLLIQGQTGLAASTAIAISIPVSVPPQEPG